MTSTGTASNTICQNQPSLGGREPLLCQGDSGAWLSGAKNVRLISPRSPEFRSHLGRMQELHPSRGGPRDPGEQIGRLAERAVRFWLSGKVGLDEERILAWRETPYGRMRYQELDAVCRVNATTLCLFEIKLTTPANMERGAGMRQLNQASETLQSNGSWHAPLRRLVYVADKPQAVRRGIDEVAPDDLLSGLGVIWVSPEGVERAAETLGLSLPAQWFDPQTRRAVDTPPRDLSETMNENALGFNSIASAMMRALAQKGVQNGPMMGAVG